MLFVEQTKIQECFRFIMSRFASTFLLKNVYLVPTEKDLAIKLDFVSTMLVKQKRIYKELG